MPKQSDNNNKQAALREHYPFRPDFFSQELHGYQIAGDLGRRAAWILLNAEDTVRDESGLWFDGPLLTGQQALELAEMVDAWIRKAKATPSETTGRHGMSNKISVNVVGEDLVVVSVSYYAAVLSVEDNHMRCVPSMTPRQARSLARHLRAAGRAIVKAEEAREAAL
jgi:hypothetical protein